MTGSGQDRLSGGRLFFSAHALRRMFQRGFNSWEVYEVASRGEVIEEYPDDAPYPSKLLLGWVGSRPVHLVLASDMLEDVHIVVTLYEPDVTRWGLGFTRRME